MIACCQMLLCRLITDFFPLKHWPSEYSMCNMWKENGLSMSMQPGAAIATLQKMNNIDLYEKHWIVPVRQALMFDLVRSQFWVIYLISFHHELTVVIRFLSIWIFVKKTLPSNTMIMPLYREIMSARLNHERRRNVTNKKLLVLLVSIINNPWKRRGDGYWIKSTN